MPKWEYSLKEVDPERTVRCSGRELRVSPKGATEVCRTIRGMLFEEAKRTLEAVTELKRPIAYRRYHKEVPHIRQSERWSAGRYPVKVARRMLRLLEELESTAEYKGLSTERLRIIHAASHRGSKVRNIMPRAFGRSSPDYDTLTHIELVGYEMP